MISHVEAWDPESLLRQLREKQAKQAALEKEFEELQMETQRRKHALRQLTTKLDRETGTLDARKQLISGAVLAASLLQHPAHHLSVLKALWCSPDLDHVPLAVGCNVKTGVLQMRHLCWLKHRLHSRQQQQQHKKKRMAGYKQP